MKQPIAALAYLLLIFSCTNQNSDITTSVRVQIKDSLKLDSFFTELNTGIDKGKKEAAIKAFAKHPFFHQNNDVHNLKYEDVNDYVSPEGEFITQEGPDQFYPCSIDDDPEIPSLRKKYDISGSKKLNWCIAKHANRLWTVNSQEKCYFSLGPQQKEISYIRHIRSQVNSIYPATWEEKYYYTKVQNHKADIRCAGVLTIRVPGLPGETLIARYQLLNSLLLTQESIELN